MSREQVKFTVIVPTRERPDTLVHCLNTLVAQDYENLTILVSDNFSEDGTREVVASFKDKRLRYVNTGRRIGMSQNWEFALSHIHSGWVTFLGDDDGLLPGAIARLDDILAEYPSEAINSAFCHYTWPGGGWSHGAKLLVPTNKGVKYLDSRTQLASVMAGRTSFSRLPWLYHGGFATIDVINRARDASGLFFMSQTPDAYSAIALSSVTDKYLRIESPLVVAGSSIHSTGASTIRRNKPEPYNKFLSEDNTPFHSSLTSGRSVHLCIYESYLQSRFLHDDFLILKLKDELEFALASASRNLRKEILQQCQETAALNGIAFTGRSFSQVSSKLEVAAIAFLTRAANITARARLVGEDAAGANVYEASLKANEIISLADSRSTFTNSCQNSFQSIVAELRSRWIARRSRLLT